MDFDQDTRALLIEYRAAHVYWKALPEGREKVDAKRNRNTLHGKVLERIALMSPKTTVRNYVRDSTNNAAD